MLGRVTGARERHLVRTPRALGLLPVDLRRARPALGCAEDDHRPHRARVVARRSACLDGRDVVEHVVEQLGEALVDRDVVLTVEATLEDVRRVAVPDHEGVQLLLADPGEDGRVGDLVAVEVEDRQDDAVLGRVDELVRVPARGERAGLGLAVTDDGRHEEVRVVERRAVRVRERVAELAALVDRSGRLWGDVARDATREGELPEQPVHALLVLGDVRVRLGVGAFEVGVGDEARSAMTWAGDEDARQCALADRPVEVGVEEVEARSGAPVSEEPGLDVVAVELGAQERVVEQVDLTDGEIVGCTPPPVDAAERLVTERLDRSRPPLTWSRSSRGVVCGQLRCIDGCGGAHEDLLPARV